MSLFRQPKVVKDTWQKNWEEITIQSLERWSSGTQKPVLNSSINEVDNPNCVTLFKVNKGLNQKIVLYMGEATSITGDAIVNSTNEKLSLFTKVIERGGDDLEFECKSKHRDGCRTGECCVTQGWKLPLKYVIHTVGPQYTEKYARASEHALLNCYRGVLAIVRERRWKSIVLPCIYSHKKGYPRNDGAHVACRTTRSLLEKIGESIKDVIFVVDNKTDFDLYKTILSLYFPRSTDEEKHAAQFLHQYHKKEAESVVRSRKIRITGTFSPPNERKNIGPEIKQGDTFVACGTLSESSEKYNLESKDEFNVESDLFSGGYSPPENIFHRRKTQINDKVAYDVLLRTAWRQSLKDIQALNCVYHSGFDQHDRAVIVIIGKNLPIGADSLERVLLYLVKIADAIIERGFIIIYAHGGTHRAQMPRVSWLRSAHGRLDRRYKKRLCEIFVLHPNFAVKWKFWVAKLYLSQKFYRKKLRYVTSLPNLFETSSISSNDVTLPASLYRYDIRVNQQIFR
eukprot:GSMAST32.ASY1.ANO1.806.1 assembled CDS